METTSTGAPLGEMIAVGRLRTLLERCGYVDAAEIRVEPLGRSSSQGVKGYGYGHPLLITFTTAGQTERVVLRTMSPDPFGHDRRADRVSNLVLALDTYGLFPRHVRPLKVGLIDEKGELWPAPNGEPFLITSYADGDLYARDLEAICRRQALELLDVRRAETLAKYLSEVHAHPASPDQYRRSLRDLVGHGEGIFGLVDSYPIGSVPIERLEAIEVSAVHWRHQMSRRLGRARRTHGDFHPFNLLFRDDLDLTILDASRGGSGDPADDVTCLSINYLFFDLMAGHRRFDGPLRALWADFWKCYLATSQDPEVLEVVAPFFAWRTLVLANPTWYPAVSPEVRETLLRFAESLLAGRPFDPDHVDALF